MISLFTQLNLSKSIYIYIYMAIVFNIFIFGSSPNLVAADCSNCSNSWTTDISSTFSYGNCVFNIDFSYRDCDTTKELRVNSIQTLTSECDTTNKTTIYKYSLMYLLSQYYSIFSPIDTWDTNTVSIISNPCIKNADENGLIEFCDDTLCQNIKYNLTGSGKFVEIIGSNTFSKNYMGSPCGIVSPCGQELLEFFYTIPPGPLYTQLSSNPLNNINCDDPCYWKLNGNDNVDDIYHFLGTTVDQDLRIKTNDTEIFRIFSEGQGFYSHEGRKSWNIHNGIDRYLDETDKFDFMFNNGIVVGNHQSWWLEDGIGNDANRKPMQDGSITLLPHKNADFYHIYNAKDFGLGISGGRYPGTHWFTENIDGQIGRQYGEDALINQPAYTSNNIMTFSENGKKVGIGTIPNKSDAYTFNKPGGWNTTTLWKSAGPEGMLTVSDTYYHYWVGSTNEYLVFDGNPVILRLERRDNGYNNGNTNYKLISAGHHNAESFLVRANAKVGINTTSEDALLNLKGLGDDDQTFSFIAKNSANINLFNIRNDGAVGVSSKLGVGINPMDNLHVIGNMRINSSNTGNALETSAITGTHSDYLLAVDGKIVAKEIIVTTSNWADYVFKPNYKLTPLSELELKIKELGRLPGMPSEAEVLENGVSINEIQVKMLEKIEELTLYMIELKKENEKLQAEVNKLKGE